LSKTPNTLPPSTYLVAFVFLQVLSQALQLIKLQRDNTTFISFFETFPLFSDCSVGDAVGDKLQKFESKNLFLPIFEIIKKSKCRPNYEPYF